MTTSTSRLSYASSPESETEMEPKHASLSLGNLPQLVKSNSDPSIATNQDNLDRDRDMDNLGMPPPYMVNIAWSLKTVIEVIHFPFKSYKSYYWNWFLSPPSCLSYFYINFLTKKKLTITSISVGLIASECQLFNP